MPKLTDPAIVATVKQMLANRTRHKVIAELVGIPVKTVERISAGTITGKPRVSETNLPKLVRVRCPECGGLIVETPCRACSVRQGVAHAQLSLAPNS